MTTLFPKNNDTRDFTANARSHPDLSGDAEDAKKNKIFFCLSFALFAPLRFINRARRPPRLQGRGMNR